MAAITTTKLHLLHQPLPSRNDASSLRHSSFVFSSRTSYSSSLSLKLQKSLLITAHSGKHEAVFSDAYSWQKMCYNLECKCIIEALKNSLSWIYSQLIQFPIFETSALVDLDWDNLGFGIIPIDYMYVTKCARGEVFSKGELKPYGNIEMSPSAGILNYGQGLFEGLKAYRTHDGNIVLFRPTENALRMISGAERMCMPAPTVEQFVEAVKEVVLANERWIPPAGKGSLYIRPLLMGSGSVLGIAPAPEYTFLIYASPVGNYFKEGLAPINLVIDIDYHRAAPGGTGGVKTIGNYAAVLKAHSAAKASGYSDVLYLDCVHKKYLEEVSSCNVFVVKDNVISTPAIKGTILPGITRKSIIDIARSLGFEVVEQLVSIDQLLDADEVFCTGTAVVVSPVGSITYMGKRTSFAGGKVGKVAQQLYQALTRLQMGLTKDTMDWVVKVK